MFPCHIDLFLVFIDGQSGPLVLALGAKRIHSPGATLMSEHSSLSVALRAFKNVVRIITLHDELECLRSRAWDACTAQQDRSFCAWGPFAHLSRVAMWDFL